MPTMSPLSPPSSLASLSPHSAMLPASRPRLRRHRSDLDLPPGANDDVLASASASASATSPPATPVATRSAASSTNGAVSATPNSQLSSDNDPSTDGSRSIPNVDLHTLAHLLSPASNRPTAPTSAAAAAAARRGDYAKPANVAPSVAPTPVFRPIPLRPDEDPSDASPSHIPRPTLARPRPTRADDATPLLRAAASRISWHRSRTELAQTLQHSPALSDELCDEDDEDDSYGLSADEDGMQSDTCDDETDDDPTHELAREDTEDATDFHPQHARVTLDAQTLHRDVSHIRHARRRTPRKAGAAPPAEFSYPSRRHRSDGVVAAWRRGVVERSGVEDRARDTAERMGACTVQAVNGAAPASPQKSGATQQATTTWPSSLQPPVHPLRRRRRSSHLAGALRRKVSSVWATGAVRAASTTAALAASEARGQPAVSSTTDDVSCDVHPRSFGTVEHGERFYDDDEETDDYTEEYSGSGGSGSGGSGGRTVTSGRAAPRYRVRTRSSNVRAAATGGASPGSRSSSHPVHPYAALAPFGLSPAADAIVLYTNSVRAEVNDLIFLASLLRRSCGPDGAAVRKRHRTLDVDFELWFQRFSQYCGLVIFGIEELVMRAVAEVLGQRDVMLSRSAAAAEAGGSAASRAAAWNAASRSLYARVDAMRDGLNAVSSAVVWLRRARTLREDPGQAAQRAVAGVRRLAPAALALMDEVDARVGEALALRADWSRALRGLYRQFAAVLAREGAAPLGWGAVVTLTRWIADRRLRAEHVKSVARAARLGMFSRFKGDCSHQAIVRVHRTLVADEDTRRVRFFV